jgi:heat shock protein beta
MRNNCWQAACKNEPESTEAKRAVELLYETALISSGYTPDSPAELGGKIYEMMTIALGGRWGRSDTETEAATTGDASTETGSSEATVTEVIEPSEVRPESDPWRD